MTPNYRRQRRAALTILAGGAIAFTLFGIYWSMH
jgi:hypothetical protein